MSAKVWKCKTIYEFPVASAREYKTRTGAEALNAVSLPELKKMLPDEVRRFIEIQTIFRAGLT